MAKLAILALLITVARMQSDMSDPNAHLFQHMLPVFQKEEQDRLAKMNSLPSLGSESEESLDAAMVKLDALVKLGHLDQGKAKKLMEALQAAHQIRHVAAVLKAFKDGRH